MWHNFYMVRENMYVEDVLEKKFHSWPKSVVNWSYTGWQNKVVANNTTDEEENCVTSFFCVRPLSYCTFLVFNSHTL